MKEVYKDRDPLPEKNPAPGEYRCGVCGGCVTVTSSGVELGHENGRSGPRTKCERREEHYEAKRGALP